MTGPDHHAEMEAHYAAGQQRQDEQHLFDIAFEEAKARVDAEIEREGFPPSAQILIAWGVGAGVRAATSRLMREIGDAREEVSHLKIDASNHAFRAETARLERDKAEVEIGKLKYVLDAITSACAQAGKDATHNHGTVAGSRRPADQRSTAYCEGILRVTDAVARLAKKHPA